MKTKKCVKCLETKNISYLGLHVPWNLQILPEILNNKKGNRV